MRIRRAAAGSSRSDARLLPSRRGEISTYSLPRLQPRDYLYRKRETRANITADAVIARCDTSMCYTRVK